MDLQHFIPLLHCYLALLLL